MNTDDIQCVALFTGSSIEDLKEKIENSPNSFEWQKGQLSDDYFWADEYDLLLELNCRDWDILESESEIISDYYKEKISIYEVINSDDEKEFIAFFYRENPLIIYHQCSRTEALEFKEFLAKSEEHCHMLELFENENELATALYIYKCFCSHVLTIFFDQYNKLCERIDFRKGEISFLTTEETDDQTAQRSRECVFRFKKEN